MAQLSKQEAAMLKRLQEKSEAPDAPAVGKTLNVSIDLGDEKQVARAMSLGLLDSLDDGSDDDDDEHNDDDEETPRRRGYFKGDSK